MSGPVQVDKYNLHGGQQNLQSGNAEYAKTSLTLNRRYMSEFIAHEPCPTCGSRDNFGRYSDGHGWCFGCGRYEPPAGFIPQINEVVKSDTKIPFPSDAQKQIGVKGWNWLKKYGILNAETLNWYWSEEKQWLLFPIIEECGIISVWQARNFNDDRPKPKALTVGAVSDVLMIHGTGEPIILVEDILSAVKVGRKCSAMPLFGSNVPLKTLIRLASRFKHLGIWLDADMAERSMRAALRAKQFGFDTTRSIVTEADPKEHSDKEINEIVTRNFST